MGNTWKDIIKETILKLDNQATRKQIYETIKDLDKAKNNSNLQAKIRQVINMHTDTFIKNEDKTISINGYQNEE